MSGNSYSLQDQGAWVAGGETCTVGAAKGLEGAAYGCNAEQRATMAELGLTLETAPKTKRGKNEWEDALIKHKVMDAPLDHKKMAYMLDMKREDEAALNPEDELAGKTLDELDELEDDIEDDKMFQAYREARLAEMKEDAIKGKFSGLVHVTAQDYIKEVTHAGDGVLVILHLYQDYVQECTRMNEVMQELSRRHKEVKWCKIKSTDANADYPDHALPTLLIYKDATVMDKMTCVKMNGGAPVTADGLEWRLAAQGLVKTELQEDPFKELGLAKMRIIQKGKHHKRTVGGGDSSDDSDDSD